MMDLRLLCLVIILICVEWMRMMCMLFFVVRFLIGMVCRCL